jgi:hypothetical protein
VLTAGGRRCGSADRSKPARRRSNRSSDCTAEGTARASRPRRPRPREPHLHTRPDRIRDSRRARSNRRRRCTLRSSCPRATSRTGHRRGEHTSRARSEATEGNFLPDHTASGIPVRGCPAPSASCTYRRIHPPPHNRSAHCKGCIAMPGTRRIGRRRCRRPVCPAPRNTPAPRGRPRSCPRCTRRTSRRAGGKRTAQCTRPRGRDRSAPRPVCPRRPPRYTRRSHIARADHTRSPACTRRSTGLRRRSPTPHIRTIGPHRAAGRRRLRPDGTRGPDPDPEEAAAGDRHTRRRSRSRTPTP